MKRRDFFKTAALGAGATMIPGVGTADGGKKVGPFKPACKKGEYFTIDAYSHFSTMDIIDKLEKLSGQSPNPFRPIFQNNLPLIDPVARIQAMDRIGADIHILVPLPYLESTPAVYASGPHGKALEAAQFINNSIYDIVQAYPTRFRGVAMLPTFNVDDMLLEFDRAINKLGFVGGLFVVSPLAKVADHPDYIKLYEKACDYDVPLWIHPARAVVPPDYTSEPASMYMNWMTVGWPMDTTTAMIRMVFSGVFDQIPNLKVIVHHKGALIPFWFNRINGIIMQQGQQMVKIQPPYLPHFQKFYIDTACPAFEPDQMKMCYEFFPPDHTLYGTDAPLDGQKGAAFYDAARSSLENIGLKKRELAMVYAGNVKKIIRGL